MNYVEQEYKTAMTYEILGWIQRPFTIVVMAWISSFTGDQDGVAQALLWIPLFVNLFGICSLPLAVFWIPSFALGIAGLFIMPVLACVSVKAQIENWQTLARLCEIRNKNAST